MNSVKWRTWGIEPGYKDALGHWQNSSPASLGLLKRAMTKGPETRGDVYRDVWVTGAGETRAIVEPSELRLEDGTVEPSGAYLRRDVPLGYHGLVGLAAGERSRRLRLRERRSSARLASTVTRCSRSRCARSKNSSRAFAGRPRSMRTSSAKRRSSISTRHSRSSQKPTATTGAPGRARTRIRTRAPSFAFAARTKGACECTRGCSGS